MSEETREHAILSASGAHRWLTCTPSARLESEYGQESCSIYAEEGTAAHRLAEIKLSYTYGKMKFSEYNEALADFHKTPVYEKWYTKEFEEYVDTFVQFVNAQTENIGKFHIYFEIRVNFSNIVPQGFGTSDVLIVTEDEIHVIDLKFGRGVPVSAVQNPQLMLYGFGALNMFPNTKTIRLSICQPRLDSTDSFVITKHDLVKWGFEYVMPRADEAIEGVGEFHASVSACRFCKVKGQCKARADQVLDEARKEFNVDLIDAGAPIVAGKEKSSAVLNYMELTPEQLGNVLTVGEQIVEWYKDVTAYALGQLAHGIKIPGYKLVEGRSTRYITDEQAVKERLMQVGIREDELFEPRKLLPLTKLESLVGKKLFATLCGDLIGKPVGKLTLAPENDRRPEVTTRDMLEAEFSTPVEENN